MIITHNKSSKKHIFTSTCEILKISGNPRAIVPNHLDIKCASSLTKR